MLEIYSRVVTGNPGAGNDLSTPSDRSYYVSLLSHDWI
jgi:hypothetical protein